MKQRMQERWSELEPLLDRLIELPVDEREDFIDSVESDDDLRALLRQLAIQIAKPGILDGDSGRYPEELIAEEMPVTSPTSIGPYRIVRLIGQGGSGSVFLAERDADGYVQTVALKLLRLGMHDPVEQDRFRRERRILARLEHPQIARLLDAGFNSDGVPWFAMEYVDGLPLTRWCDQHKADIESRLRLFDEVCAAVSHAHRALIVHRDLKPANILVDADGRPHLLDFGIARLLETDLNEDATRTGLRRLTPAYAAPEQFDGGVISTATDVYALGVLLHELLTGLRPVRLVGEDCRLASATLASADAGDALARTRDESRKSFQRSLRGDLDTIIATALAQEPGHRYASVEALADDLRRQCAGHPISARRASLAYRLRKFIGRQRIAVALASLLLISLIVGVAATLRETRHAKAAAADALHEAARADAVKD
ncbi:MAG: serine/threonine-protein kinase, partial [Dokdonella sp.]